ncbi:PAS domain S-box protein [bacterium]|nr:PAS domain S-box protein [bacterium]
MPNAAVVVDEAGLIAAANRQTESIFGYAPDELIGQPVEILIPTRMRARHVDQRSAHLSAPGGAAPAVLTDVAGRKKDASEFPADVHLVPFRSHRRRWVMATVRDVSARKQLENQLYQSRKMESVGWLAAGVAHDFNNLLTGIMGYAEVILRTIPPEMAQTRADLKEIKTGSERAARLTRQLLTYARRPNQEPVVICVNDLLIGMDRMLAKIAGKHIDFRLNLGEGLGLVKVSPGQAEQVILNLVVNARDAMPGGGALTIETANVHLEPDDLLVTEGGGQGCPIPEAPDSGNPRTGFPSIREGGEQLRPGPHVRLSVTDTGVGMPPDVQSRMFEPFFTTKDNQTGSGLGLSTCSEIIRKSGGHIGVRTAPGEGTTVTVYFPRAREEWAGAGAPGSTIEPPGGSESILVVEDDPARLSLIERILKGKGYTVHAVRSAEETVALSQRSNDGFHLILSDIVLPVMTGRDMARIVKASHPGIKCLLMSGYTDEVLIHHAPADPSIAFIQKPFTPSDLARKIREVLDTPAKGAKGDGG